MTACRSEGVILKAIPFKEADQILTAFTPEGILKLFSRGSLSRRRGAGSMTMPLQLVEFVYTRGKGELATCNEISMLNPFLGLRKKLAFLESAGGMSRALLSTQQSDEPAPLLYLLFLCYLESLPLAKDPSILASSMKLKILRHEGVLALEARCSFCQKHLKNIYLAEGESFCHVHAPQQATFFEGDDSALLLECTYGRSLGRMLELASTPFFGNRVDHLFSTLLGR